MTDVIIVYDSTTGNTEKVAQEILNGVKESGASVEMKKVNEATVEELRKAKAIILGSPNIHDTYSGPMRDFVDQKLTQAKPAGKMGAAFGTHKWNTDNVKKLEQDMRWLGMLIVAEGVNVHRRETEEAQKVREFGKKIGEEAKKAP